MKLQSVLALSVLVFAGTSAFADEITIATDRVAVSTKTRAAVQAEARGANLVGVLPYAGTETLMAPMSAMSRLSREEVLKAIPAARNVESVAEGA